MFFLTRKDLESILSISPYLAVRNDIKLRKGFRLLKDRVLLHRPCLSLLLSQESNFYIAMIFVCMCVCLSYLLNLLTSFHKTHKTWLRVKNFKRGDGTMS